MPTRLACIGKQVKCDDDLGGYNTFTDDEIVSVCTSKVDTTSGNESDDSDSDIQTDKPRITDTDAVDALDKAMCWAETQDGVEPGHMSVLRYLHGQAMRKRNEKNEAI